MQPLPQEFLEQVATEKYLTDEQRDAFVALYKDANRAPESIAGNLHISDNAFRTRLSGVYKAFGIDGKGSNKKRRLHQELLEMYRQRQGRDSDDPILDRGIDDFVERIRRQVAADIKQRCGTMRVLDIVGLGEIYTDVNILAKVSRTSRKGLEEMHEIVGLDLENFQRFSFGEIAKERVAGLEVVKEHRKLMIWGKPGAGKTTFLKHLAMSCIRGELFPELVPFFVTLKSFAEEDGKPNLFTHLQAQAEMHGVNPERLKEIINAGRAMILLDGLDEVRQEDSQRVIKGIQEFADIWRENFFAITCRIAAKEYTFQNGFTEVEVADFNQKQIACFVNNWFRCKKQDKKAEGFINALQEQETIQELASSPLLLTLLCLVFEENFHFPQNRAELYKEGLDILLKKWDSTREIQRDKIYKNLTVKRREQMLSEIAFKTFEKGEYFFKKSRAENLILEFIQNLPDAKDDPEALRLDSEVVLKAIEAQHGILVERAKGIYSFSHLTFQEYLAANYISIHTHLHSLLIEHFSNKRWREVISLTFEEIQDINKVSIYIISCMEKIQNRIAAREKIQSLLVWISNKEISEEKIKVDIDIAQYYSSRLGFRINSNIATFSLYSRYLYLECFLFEYELIASATYDFTVYKNLTIDLSIYSNIHMGKLSLWGYKQMLKDLKTALDQVEKHKLNGYSDLHDIYNQISIFKTTKDLNQWQSKKIEWLCNSLHNWLSKYRNFEEKTYYSHFFSEEGKFIKEYFEDSVFLLSCLQSTYIRRDVREWIENTMFLPMSEIEKIPPPEL